MTDLYEPPDLTGTAITWGEEPQHHAGDRVYPGRRVAVIPGRVWPNAPEQCTADTLLVCLGCGLDST